MKLITILINKRTDHIVDFDSATDDIQSYIVENPGGVTNLFGFYKESKDTPGDELILQTNQAQQIATLCGLKVSEGSKDEASQFAQSEINMYLKYSSSELSQDVNSDDLYQSRGGNKITAPTNEIIVEPQGFVKTIDKNCWDPRNLKVSYEGKAGWAYIIKVTLHLFDEVTGQYGNQSFIINLSPKEQIYDIVLDYGSEASQMLIYKRGSKGKLNLQSCVPLFTQFKASYYADKEEDDLENSSFSQFDKDGDIFFFRSYFFAKTNPKFSDDEEPLPFIKFQNDENIRLMTPVSETEALKKDHIIIPNIKVAGHGGVGLPMLNLNGTLRPIFEIGDRYYYRSIVNSFLLQALRYSIDDLGNKHVHPRFINLYLLMPNVYTQVDISKNLSYAAADLMSMVKDNKELSSIKGVEVAAVSESDASFLGFISALPPNEKLKFPAGKYLIMDAGKGTLDFSILKYDPMNQTRTYESIFRSGIIGAGNAITYSVFLSVLKDIYRSHWTQVQNDTILQDISNFIINNVTNKDVDEAQLSTMVNLLEQYKVLYNNGELIGKQFPANLGNLSSFSDFKLEALNNCLLQMIQTKYLINDDSYIVNMIDSLCHDAAVKISDSYSLNSNNIEDARIDYVIFAGRGFLMNRLREMMVKRLKQHNPEVCANIQPKTVNTNGHESGATFKNLCLFIIGPLASGRYNGRLVGRPQVLNRNVGKIHYPSQSNTGETDTPNVISTNWFGKIKNVFTCIASKLPGPIHNYSYEDDDYGNRIYGNVIETLNRGLVKGFPVNFITKDDLIVFSGVAYNVPGGIELNKKAEIFFDGRDFIIRQDGNINEFVIPVDLSAAHVFESLFPYGKIPRNRTIPIPGPVAASPQPSVSSNSLKDSQSSPIVDGYGEDDESVLKKHNK